MEIKRKHIFMLAVAVIVFVQAPHLSFIFRDMSEFSLKVAWVHGILFAIAIDACVLVFAMKGRNFQTAIFAIISFVITIQYYEKFLTTPISIASTIMIAASGVLAVFYLSHEIKKMEVAEKDRSVEKLGNKKYTDGLEAGLAQGEIDTLERNDVFQFSEKDKKILKMKDQKRGMIEITETLDVTENDVKEAMNKLLYSFF